MITAPDGTPWWVWLVGLAVVAIVAPILTSLVSRHSLKPIREQLENDHANHPHSNLRVQMDEIHKDIRDVRDEGRRTRAEQEGIRNDLREARAWIGAEAAERRHLSTSLEEHIRQSEPVVEWVRQEMTMGDTVN